MAEKFDKQTHTTRWIQVKYLSVVWSAAQRPLDKRWVKKLADNFDPNLFGNVSVSMPDKDGMHHIVDGQHRAAAVALLFGEEERVPCNILPASDPAQAARLFAKLHSDRRKLQPIDIYRARVTAGEEAETAIDKIVTELGYRIEWAKRDGSIAAVNALTQVYKRHGGDVLRQALQLIKATWGKNPEAVVAPIIYGYAALVSEYGPHAKWVRLVDRVSKKYTPGRLVGTARNMREALQCSMGEATKRVIVNAYNHGLRGNHKLGELEAA